MEQTRIGKLILLENRPVTKLKLFLNGTIDEWFCHSKAVDYSNFQDVWTLEEWFQIQKEWTEFIKAIFAKGWTKESVLQETSYLNEKYQQLICDCLIARKDDISINLMTKTSRITSTSLKDFDWQLKLVLGSDKLAKVKYALAAVQFYIKKEGHNQKFDVEMSQEELNRFISSLEAAQKAAIKAASK